MQRLIIALIGIALLVGAGACTNENLGWPHAESRDWHIFKSTKLQPLSISIFDLVTREQVHRIDIPVDHTCKVKFYTRENRTHSLSTVPAQYKLTYFMHNMTNGNNTPHTTVELENPVRMDAVLRDTIEIPEPVPTEADIMPAGTQSAGSLTVEPQPQTQTQTQPDTEPTSDLEDVLE